MPEKDLIEAVRASYMQMKEAERIREIREMARKSAEDADFIRRYFPELYSEAFPQRRLGEADACLESNSQSGLAAKPR